MKIFAVSNDPMVLNLVAHFLGIAEHHNDNAAPSSVKAPTVDFRR